MGSPHAEGAGTTTVTIAQDVDSCRRMVNKLVDEVNAALSRLKALSKLQRREPRPRTAHGDATARRMVDQLRRGVMDVFSGLTGDRTRPPGPSASR